MQHVEARLARPGYVPWRQGQGKGRHQRRPPDERSEYQEGQDHVGRAKQHRRGTHRRLAVAEEPDEPRQNHVEDGGYRMGMAAGQHRTPRLGYAFGHEHLNRLVMPEARRAQVGKPKPKRQRRGHGDEGDLPPPDRRRRAARRGLFWRTNGHVSPLCGGRKRRYHPQRPIVSDCHLARYRPGALAIHPTLAYSWPSVSDATRTRKAARASLWFRDRRGLAGARTNALQA